MNEADFMRQVTDLATIYRWEWYTYTDGRATRNGRTTVLAVCSQDADLLGLEGPAESTRVRTIECGLGTGRVRASDRLRTPGRPDPRGLDPRSPLSEQAVRQSRAPRARHGSGEHATCSRLHSDAAMRAWS